MLLKGYDIICISSIDWDFIWQGHQQIMSTLAENGSRVLFIDNTGVRAPVIRDIPRIKQRLLRWWRSTKGFRKHSENLFIYSPLIIPFPYSRIARKINRFIVSRSVNRWMRAVGFSNPILWIFLPTPFALDMMETVDAKIKIYYCIDNLSESSFLARKVVKPEIEVFRRSDLIFVTSQNLYQRARRYNNRVEIFPFGVDLERFEKVRTLPSEVVTPQDMKQFSRPIAGYIGGIHKWIDQELIAKTAKLLPQVNFVFIGPVQTSVAELQRLTNVFLIGPRTHEDIPNYVRTFDVGLIPYLTTRYTAHVYPTKLNEYLAMGKPVVSTFLEEIDYFNKTNGDLVRIGSSPESFASQILESTTDNSAFRIKERLDVVEQNSWQKRIERMAEVIRVQIGSSDRSLEVGWEERLRAFYYGSYRYVFSGFVAGMLLFVLLLFYSPIIWSLAEPLKLSEMPSRSDAIVVFGGGVGEGGRPGASTVERARYAAQLYHKGYAPAIVFSSSYSYTSPDAENMKLIALSLGVPVRAILLDNKASSTYENVRYSTEMLRERNMKSALIVSSPYNMRRAALVFQKWARELKVVYTPVPGPQFYDSKKGKRWDQVKAILHEYVGIVYYWLKGYI